jgi:type II protein arginine methyltransferase
VTSLAADPIVPPLTPDDTGLFPSSAVNTYTAYSSAWIDLGSSNPVIANISRQVLNLEVAYANFCGVRSIIIPGPRKDVSHDSSNGCLSQYARAIQEALAIGSRINFLIHIPMYREPGLEEKIDTISSLLEVSDESPPPPAQDIDLFSSWDSWHHIRTVCSYNLRLFVGK